MATEFMRITQKQFDANIGKFTEIEDRGEFWYRARNLLLAGYELEAYVLILATWNFAGFRYLVKNFDLRNFESTIDKLNPNFDKLSDQSLWSVDLEDPLTTERIQSIYQELKNIVKQTGASKIMALKNPGLFVMWDTNIRKLYRINNTAHPHDYIQFLKKMKQEFAHIKWTDSKRPLAKAIDEYNYVKAGSAQ